MTKLFVSFFEVSPSEEWSAVQTSKAAVQTLLNQNVSHLSLDCELGYGPGIHWDALQRLLRETYEKSPTNLSSFMNYCRQTMPEHKTGSGDTIAVWLYLAALHGYPSVECTFYNTPTVTATTFIRQAQKIWSKRPDNVIPIRSL